jgi:predicted Rossmann fold nucleotide-binding protein DprA/Smf involved in DNA uptake
MQIGFTGSRKGMTAHQKFTVRHILNRAIKDCNGNVVVHHGGCVGADEEFHRMCLKLGLRIIIHPSDKPDTQAACEQFWQRRPQAPPLQRNRYIVSSVGLLIATPDSTTERLRSGTWATVRYARRDGSVGLHVIPPGG